MLNLSQTPGVSVPPAGSASATAIRRLQKDYAKLMEDPVDGINAIPNEDNILEWHYCLRGSPDTPFHGGFYWGKVIFKENFPWSPPAITMITPNGRFATNVRLCLSISDYHPESWNPGWTVSAILIGLHSFMNENQPAAGSIPGKPEDQRQLASASKEFNVKYREFRRFFPQLVHEWTGVYPSPGEPNVAPKMLPQHATPHGVPVPDLSNHSSRAAFNLALGRDVAAGIPGPGGNPLHPFHGILPFGAVGGAGGPAGPPGPPQAPPPAPPGGYMMRMMRGPPNPPGPPQYHDLIAIAQAQEQARQQVVQAAIVHRQQAQQIAMQEAAIAQERLRQNAALAAQRMQMAENYQYQAPPIPPPQQRVLRPRAHQDGVNERRAEMLERLGMGQDQNGVRRNTRRMVPAGQVAPPKELDKPE
uniref:Ubiquitin-conjugating enzyme E2 J2 n=1 Tax=Caenorhabditis tropicalis TaxID=1561998 RepID=A0A1I7U213_9PELO